MELRVAKINMLSFIHFTLIIIYILCSVSLMVYGAHCYAMIFLFLKKNKRSRARIREKIEAFNKDKRPIDYPFVTIQLPIYNEMDVVRRLLRSAAKVDYPRNRFEIQVLDDSTDETREILDKTIAEIQAEGIEIYAVRRDNRRDFKAGALANGLLRCKGEYVSIFDSDFIVPLNFLKRSIALIHGNAEIACVQGRWGHTNREENWITRAQSIGIDGHFTAEQGARGYSNLCLNFNGTAGTWNVRAIEAAGGWQGDTLTEDLDLSYRAQLAGYKITYDFDLECPAEIPNNVVALKSQQKRWAKGSIETAVKLIPSIVRCKTFSPFQKIEACLHLTHYFVAVLMTILFSLTLPMLLWTPIPQMGLLLHCLWVLIIFSAMAPCVMYTTSGWILRHGLFSFSNFPSMLVVGTGLCINNALAVLEGLCGQKSEFIRTPKSGSTSTSKRNSRYKVKTHLSLGVIELIAGIYCLFSLFVYFDSSKYIFGFFIAAYAVGLLSFGFLTLKGFFLSNSTRIQL